MDFKINIPTALNKKYSIIFISKSNETKFHKFAEKINIDIALKKTFEYMNISRKCKFICSNCVIVSCFENEFNKYKHLQKMKHIRNKKNSLKYAHFQNDFNKYKHLQKLNILETKKNLLNMRIS